ncbi:MAG: autoinducer binding domain-containing protein [Xanthomonadaceae bacterium]|nr:autoinducer binding domain-containing protein [Xanthomonadaceae bacterium]MDE1963843.1 LuxR family transcriptional regulator [Xanthomonadaceae bacterium]
MVRLGDARSSMQSLVHVMRDITGELGFEHCSYVLRQSLPIAQPAFHWGSTYPQAWLDRYVDQNYFERDPLVQNALDSEVPVVWSDRSVERLPEFWEEARSFGINHGWAVSSRGRDRTVGLLTVARQHDAVSAEELEQSEMRLLWLAHAMHGVASLLPDVAQPVTEPLSAREREVLLWSAAGKTADEIGLILAISTRTVTFHINRCIAKLGAANKTEAVSKALVLGLL